MARPSRYSTDFRARAVRLVSEARTDHDTEWAAMTSVATKLGSALRWCVSGCVASKWTVGGARA
jgi:hypothetical protein